MSCYFCVKWGCYVVLQELFYWYEADSSKFKINLHFSRLKSVSPIVIAEEENVNGGHGLIIGQNLQVRSEDAFMFKIQFLDDTLNFYPQQQSLLMECN